MAQSREILEAVVAEDPSAWLSHDRPEIRRLAVAALRRLGPGAVGSLGRALHFDGDDQVRAEAAEALGHVGGAEGCAAVTTALADPSMRVVEAAVTALGELADPGSVPRLIEIATAEGDPLVREAAVAALGAIGDERALPALLDLARGGRPQLRRRAVVALTAFEGPEVEAAFRAAQRDRNPMVREAAEMVIGRAAPHSPQPSALSPQPDDPAGPQPTADSR